MPENGQVEPIPPVKDLASSEPSVRRTCLKTIISHLTERAASSPLTSTQCLQLWRGLYVALYMHDSKNALSVQQLAAELAATVKLMAAKDEVATGSAGDENSNSKSSLSWLDTWATAFWETICREWTTIDQWRMNKVLMLVRFFLRETFNVCFTAIANDTDTTKANSKDLVPRQRQILETWPLSPRERKVPDGLRLHVLDVWVDELLGQLDVVRQSGNVDDDDNAVAASLQQVARDLMTPVETISRQALSKGVKMRAKDAIQLFQEKTSS
ncbi:hypothetical protein KCU88_g1659, partial [Aureobasidium melanogenum]